MFAEARGMVPVWHPIYRSHYTIESLCDAIAGPAKGQGFYGKPSRRFRDWPTRLPSGTLGSKP